MPEWSPVDPMNLDLDGSSEVDPSTCWFPTPHMQDRSRACTRELIYLLGRSKNAQELEPRVRPSDSRVGVFICESFWVIYTSFDVIPLMLGQHQERDPPLHSPSPFSFPCALLQFFLCWEPRLYDPFLNDCVPKFQSKFHARLILFWYNTCTYIRPRGTEVFRRVMLSMT